MYIYIYIHFRFIIAFAFLSNVYIFLLILKVISCVIWNGNSRCFKFIYIISYIQSICSCTSTRNIRWNHSARFSNCLRLSNWRITQHSNCALCSLRACCGVIAHIIMLDTKKHPHPAHSGEPICTFISILCMSPSNIPSSPPLIATHATHRIVYFCQ